MRVVSMPALAGDKARPASCRGLPRAGRRQPLRRGFELNGCASAMPSGNRDNGRERPLAMFSPHRGQRGLRRPGRRDGGPVAIVEETEAMTPEYWIDWLGCLWGGKSV